MQVKGDAALKMFHHRHMEQLRRRCNHLNPEIERKFRRDEVEQLTHPRLSLNENSTTSNRMSNSQTRTVVIKFKVKQLELTNFLSSSAKFLKAVISPKCKIFQIQIFCLNLQYTKIFNLAFIRFRATSQPTPTSAAGQAFAQAQAAAKESNNQQ